MQVFDIIYDPIQTILIKVANKSTKNLNGLEMNLEQAVLAYSIVNKFTNIDLIKKIMKKNNFLNGIKFYVWDSWILFK